MPITSKDVFPKRSAKMIDGTDKFKISLNFAKRVFVLYHFMLPGNFYYGSEIRHGIFWGINFGQAIFWGFDFCPHSIIPVT